MMFSCYHILILGIILHGHEGESDIVTQDNNLMVNNEFKIGHPLYITCSRAAVGNFSGNPERGIITKITLKRQSKYATAVVLASYHPINPFRNFKVIKPVANMNGWTFTMDGSIEAVGYNLLNASNINTIQLALNIDNPVCDDAGNYSCQFDYYENQRSAISVYSHDVTAGLDCVAEAHGYQWSFQDPKDVYKKPLNVGARWELRGQIGRTEPETVDTFFEVSIPITLLESHYVCDHGINLLMCKPYGYEVPDNVTNVCYCSETERDGWWDIHIRREAELWQNKGPITAKLFGSGARRGIDSEENIGDLPQIIIFHVPLCESPWKTYYDKWRKQKYCYRKIISPPKTFSEASQHCNKEYNSKLATPHGKYNDEAMFFSDNNTARWIGVIHDPNQDNKPMLMYNDGVPMDTSWLSWTPWDTANGQPSSNLHCTTIRNGLWTSRSCTEKFQYICEFKICSGDGWKYNPFSDRCNKAMSTEMTFDDASKSCAQQGAIVETPRSRQVEFLLLTFAGQSKLWLGMMNIEERSTWRWHDGARVTWTGWKGLQDPWKSRRHVCMYAAPRSFVWSASVWYQSKCRPNKNRFVCGKITCRFPYQSVAHADFTPFYLKCYRCLTNERLNARQAGQFCSEDGAKSNPAKLSAPNNQIEHEILRSKTNDLGCSGSKWMGFTFNHRLSKWQWNDLSIDGEVGNGWNRWRDHYKPRNRARAGYACAADPWWADHWLAERCNKKFGFACEKQQPYVLSGCDRNIPNAKLIHDYYPQIPPSQRMLCYYFHINDTSRSFAENDRFCASLGGYPLMPKTVNQLLAAHRSDTQKFPSGQNTSFWIGADNIGHCYNKREWCTPHLNTYTFLDGSPFDFIPAAFNVKLNNVNHSENCLAVVIKRNVNEYLLIDVSCTSQRQGMCQVLNNNLRAHRNWDFLTACKPTYRAGAPEWHAAPGDICYGTPALVARWLPWIRECSLHDSCTAKPLDKEQTRALVLSQPKLVNVSWIGIFGFKLIFNVSGENGFFLLPGERIPAKVWNWGPGTPDLTNYWPKNPDYLLCNSIGLNGKWLRGNCYDKRRGSCEKAAVASLNTWRSSRPPLRTSIADGVHIDIFSILIVIIINLLCGNW